MDPRASLVGQVRCLLGESPLWDPDLGRLFLVDARGPAVFALDPSSGAARTYPAPAMVGSVALGPPGTLIVGVGPGVSRLDLSTGAFTPLQSIALAPGERLNDGKTDRAGRFVTGSLTEQAATPPTARLWRFDAGRRPQVLESGIGVSNAIAFSPSGDRMYFADSLRMKVWAYPYDDATGELGPRSDFVDTAPLGSFPDGATVDAEGRLWLALVMTGRIACFSPDGALERLVDSPVPYPSCPAFGGPDLDVLYVTAISDSGGLILSDHPDAGRLVAIEGLGVRGLAEARCRF